MNNDTFVRVYPKQDVDVLSGSRNILNRSPNYTSALHSTRDRTTTNTKFIHSPHVFIRNRMIPYYSPSVKMNGDVNTICNKGWEYLGKADGQAIIFINNSFSQRSCSLEFSLQQFDDFQLEMITGLNTTSITPTRIDYNFQNDFIRKEILLVIPNLNDLREVQMYSPSCNLSLNFEQNGEDLGLNCRGELEAYIPDGVTTPTFFNATWFS